MLKRKRSLIAGVSLVASVAIIVIIALLASGDLLSVGQSDSLLTVGQDEAWFTVGYTAAAAAPTVTSATPSTAYRGDTPSVVIAGTDFTGASAVSFGADISVDSFSVDTALQITANITVADGAAYGYRDIEVTTPGGSDNLTNGFRVLSGDITGVSPSHGTVSDNGTVVVITGLHFDNTTAVDFGADVTVWSFTLDSTVQVSATIGISDNATPGYRDVTITTDYETIVESNGFEVEAEEEPGDGVDAVTIVLYGLISIAVCVFIFLGVVVIGKFKLTGTAALAVGGLIGLVLLSTIVTVIVLSLTD